MTGTVRGRRLGRPSLDEAAAIREAFLNQAFLLLSERGVHGFSMDALAATSGVTKRTIYRHYDSKAALIEAVVEREVQRLTDIDDLPGPGSAPPLERLRVWAWRLFQYLSRQDAQRLGLLLRFASLSEPWAADMLTKWTRRLLDAGRGLVAAAQTSGDLRACDPGELLSLLLDLIDGVFNRIRHTLEAGTPSEGDHLELRFRRRWLAFLALARPDWSGRPAG